MGAPRFSIVIPTRERADTLHAALRTCLEQDYEDYEIVVCDNCSSGETKAVVDSLASSRIVYHRSPAPLCMVDNWNLAYSLSRGQYVSFIGDDDGLMPYAFSQLDALIRNYGAKAIRWNWAVYSWPDIARADLVNYLQLSLTRELKWLEGRRAIADVTAGHLPATYLPNLYHGMAAREILEEIRNKTGRVFASYCPDTYTSFAIAYHVERYLSLSAPMSVSGFSKSSNNIAFGFMRGKHLNTKRYKAENAASGLRLHPWAPDLPAGECIIADSFLTAKQDLFPDDPSLALDRRLLAESLLCKMPIDDVAEWPAAIDEIRRTLLDDPKLTAWLEERVKLMEPKASPRESYRWPVEGVSAGYLHLDTTGYRVRDVASATKLAARILGYVVAPIAWNGEEAREAGSLRRFLASARLAIILGLHRKWGPQTKSQPAAA